MAEAEGFEPSVRFYPHNGLANRFLKPLGHASMLNKFRFRDEPHQNNKIS